MNMKVLGAVAALGLLAGCVTNIEEVGKAQVKFDCWVHEQDEGWQKDEIAARKNDLMAALDELEKKEAAAPAAGTMAPGNYTVYFDFDKAVINAAGQQVINQVLADARMH